MQHKRYHLSIVGPAQGAGTRPYCLRLANQLQLSGHICNSGERVKLELQGPEPELQQFLQQLIAWLPDTAQLSIDNKTAPLQPDECGFSLRMEDISAASSATLNLALMPDRVPCEACLRELYDSSDRRYGYAFISCTDCGPRYGISHHAPFERQHTSLQSFPLCAACEAEYTQPADRRFHAQTISCPDCGPRFSLRSLSGETLITDQSQILASLIQRLQAGVVVAVKGNSGFHLLADPQNPEAVERLRLLKQRPAKPFALMYPHLSLVRQHTRLSEAEQRVLQAPEGPLVLLDKTDSSPAFSEAVAPGCAQLGIMLPGAPVYHLLQAQWQRPLIVTSANRKGMPLVADFCALQQQFSGEDAIDSVLDHNLSLVDAMDDAIVQLVADQPMLLRPGRGFAPQLFTIPELETPVLATGALLKNTLAYAQKKTLILGRYLGDMDDLQTQQLQQQQIARLLGDKACSRLLLVGDKHPDQQTGNLQAGLPQLMHCEIHSHSVPHHLAHALAGELEHQLREPYLAICWDGLGYGEDGGLWGGEFLSVSAQGYQRIGRIRPLPLIGGEQAFREPRYMALALLMVCAENSLQARSLLDNWLHEPANSAGWDSQQQHLLAALVAGQGQGLPQISSVGRLFDGVASLLDICHINHHEGEAAMRLQSFAQQSAQQTSSARYQGPLDIEYSDDLLELDWRSCIVHLLQQEQADIASLAAQFHDFLLQGMLQIIARQPCQTVMLTGGCFQNKVLLQSAYEQLTAAGYQVYWPQKLPINDSGIAAGQVMAMIKQQGLR